MITIHKLYGTLWFSRIKVTRREFIERKDTELESSSAERRNNITAVYFLPVTRITESNLEIRLLPLGVYRRSIGVRRRSGDWIGFSNISDGRSAYNNNGVKR